MNQYHKLISEATGVTNEFDLHLIMGHMRSIIFQSELDDKTHTSLVFAARMAWRDLQLPDFRVGVPGSIISQTPEIWFLKMDWDMLRKQKAHLLEVMELDITQAQYESLQGILHGLDSAQDIAADYLGIPESTVFNLSSEEDE